MAGKIRIDGDASGYTRATDKVKASNKEVEKSLQDIKRENDALERKARRVWEQSRTPLERYNEELKELKGHLREGRISTETFGRAQDAAADRFRKAEHAGKDAFGPKAIAMLGRYAGGVAGIVTVLNSAKTALVEYAQKQQEIGQQLEQLQESRGVLFQLNDPDLALAQAQQLMLQGVVQQQGEAANRIAFGLQSASVTDAREIFGRAAAADFLPASQQPQFLEILGQVREGARGRSVDDIMDIILASSGDSPSQMAAIGKGVGRFALTAANQGLAFEEVAALQQLGATAMGSNRAAEGAASFFKQVSESQKARTLIRGGTQVFDIRGDSAEDIFRNIQQYLNQGFQISEILPESTGREFAEKIAPSFRRGEAQETIKDMERAARENRFMTGLGRAEQDARRRGILQQRMAIGEEMVVREMEGAESNRRQAVRIRGGTAVSQAFGGDRLPTAVGESVANRAGQLMDMAGIESQGAVQTAGILGGIGFGGAPSAIREGLISHYLQRIAAAAEGTKRNTQGKPAKPDREP